MVYKLVANHKQKGVAAYKAQSAGRHRMVINPRFVDEVIRQRKETDYGSEKLHYVLKRQGFGVSQHTIQRILDEQGLTNPCPKRRGQRKYVRYQWPISNYMWHTDWSQYEGEWYIAYLDDRSRRIMAAGVFKEALQRYALHVLYQAMLVHGVCPVILLSDKGTQFYNSTRNRKGERPLSVFEQIVGQLGIDCWTSRRNHPQTNGKMEKWFDTMKKRLPKHQNLKDFVRWYNEERIHHALEYKTPEEIYWSNL